MDQAILVDEYDREIGQMEKIEAHRVGSLHRAFSVFLENESGELLVHRRADGKYHSGGLWANACDGHPRAGETIIASAQRRVAEELGIDCSLFETDQFIYRVNLDHDLLEHEFLHVLKGIWNAAVWPDPKEISEVRWLKPSALQREINQNESDYCYWTRLAFARLLRMPKPNG